MDSVRRKKADTYHFGVYIGAQMMLAIVDILPSLAVEPDKKIVTGLDD